jgi:hypothetical protein
MGGAAVAGVVAGAAASVLCGCTPAAHNRYQQQHPATTTGAQSGHSAANTPVTRLELRPRIVQRVLVTGGANGIGRGIVDAFLAVRAAPSPAAIVSSHCLLACACAYLLSLTG